ncbi:hypothetical protein AtNW77_Chr3g0172981 [Arabidopsis thaliana]|uniref:Uncharacterized protein n=4 Tax=Arabidopsis TaxID=3701 RepID=A0A654F7N3_ARATH|nr:uncharacterized protein AT3G16117 [Arabidopsis thaliana]KAG7625427.1 hypothetical protein ISN45_At03g016630 [Arabidopsis thaliana x Arabidopsis arenosa]KAG7631437.1 hypothetical protein ISN44_As03g016630 [Arabidopsis suecica]AEE75773.1 hypothetical protein AT3G16117 [Arabidopsis thaliana]CAA0382602.1 unnamed protein product [Arabidopsis thaliana]VYS57547.1 unnamed protein product [Arabidopsis thaliana]|eukprot:NP_001118644.1 hypothetical protein AT3G16117 [Arabidopsis thaliana]
MQVSELPKSEFDIYEPLHRYPINQRSENDVDTRQTHHSYYSDDSSAHPIFLLLLS